MHKLPSILLTFFTLSTMINADSINQLIQESLEKHPSLRAIQYRLSAMDKRIENSQNWSNPELILNVNDIRFDDPTNRALEPMQYQAINYKQRFPWFGKLDAKERYTYALKDVISDDYEISKVKLAQQIKLTAYTIIEIKERISIVKNYEKLTQQNIALYDAYTATDTMNHSNSMAAELLLSRLHIRMERYRAVLSSQKAKLSYLVQKKNISIAQHLSVHKPKSLSYYLSNLFNNPSYKKTLSQKEVASRNSEVKALDVNPDPFVQIGYFNRQEYEDYASISVGFAMPIFGTEKNEAEAARRDTLAAQSASLDYKFALESEIRTNYAKLKEYYNIYNIIQKDSMPKLKHMFALNEASIKSGEDLFTYTNLLEQKLDLDEERTVAKAAYLRLQAQLDALIGKIK
ncbi:MAG TPA: TolC family protein [Sulfurovum sp.]|nr:TolC family protein [Sulfurovum sp.]